MVSLKKLLTNICTNVSSIQTRLNNEVDYVVEQGSYSDTSKTAKYRKGNSGKSELFSYHGGTASTSGTGSSPITYNDYSTFENIFSTICPNIFNSPPFVQVTPRSSQGINMIPSSVTQNGIASMRFLSVNLRSGVAYAFCIYALGTGK